VTGMEEDTGSKASDAVEESDSERRRRRRRRRKKKKGSQVSVETQRLLLIARWAVGALVMLATWGTGIYTFFDKGPLYALLYFPAGIAALIGVSYALAIPFVAVLAMIVGFIYRINSGPIIAFQFALVAFVGVGILNGVWRIFVFFMTKREVTRNEAGFK
jgi:hypothetical protein